MKKLIIIQCFFIYACSFAQEKWSLDQCIDYALNHNLKLKDLNYNIKSSKENYRQSFREFLPSVGVQSSYFKRLGRSLDPNTNSFVSDDLTANEIGANARLDLFQGFQKLNTIASTKFLYKAALEENLNEKYLLAFRVMTAFYDIQFFKESLEISKEQEAISQANYDLVKRQVELGLKAGADLYQSESLLFADKLIVTQNKNDLRAAELVLIREMNLQNETKIEINNSEVVTVTEEELQEIDSDAVYGTAVSFIPIIKSQEFQVKAARKDIANARGALYPSLSFFANYNSNFSSTTIDEDTGRVIPFSSQINTNARQTFGLSINIPISNKWSSRSQIKQQKIAFLRAKNNLETQKQELNRVIQELIQDFEASKTEYGQSTQSEALNLQAFNVAKKKYEKGLISVIELNQSKNAYAKAQNENLQIKLKLTVQKKTLDFYNGLPVFNIDKTK
ncbi:TolC family protein [Flavobacteriaceae bacterium R38]|nr:TolC family protein [Flavobacteriaceae bacterium R38]